MKDHFYCSSSQNKLVNISDCGFLPNCAPSQCPLRAHRASNPGAPEPVKGPVGKPCNVCKKTDREFRLKKDGEPKKTCSICEDKFFPPVSRKNPDKKVKAKAKVKPKVMVEEVKVNPLRKNEETNPSESSEWSEPDPRRETASIRTSPMILAELQRLFERRRDVQTEIHMRIDELKELEAR